MFTRFQNGTAELNCQNKYLCICGGYTTFDMGCTPWGTVCSHDANFLGDRIGQLILRYEDSTTDSVPLVFGYTLWFYDLWEPKSEPFLSDDEYSACLDEALFLYGAKDRRKACFLNIALRDKHLLCVTLQSETGKQSVPVLYGAYAHNGSDKTACRISDTEEVVFDPSNNFYRTHTVTKFGKVPAVVEAKLSDINRAMLTYFSDFDQYFVSDKKPPLIFDGDAYYRMLTEILYENRLQLLSKVDDDGLFHASNRDEYEWFYQGFGPYRRFGAFYGKLYSRDAGRSIMTLLLTNGTDKAKLAVDCLHKWLMYYPDSYPDLTFQGEKIGGHWSVMPNFPLIYSTELVPNANWKTRYTKEKFGDTYANLGNLETDGHGLVMMAVYCLWVALNKNKTWLESNYRYIAEAANFLTWQIDNPELTFTRDDVLYGETEGAMNDYTLYANIPCMLGMKLYAEMAQDIGQTEDAEKWLRVSERIESAVNRNFITEHNSWKNYGFFHDPVMTMFYDIAGNRLDMLMPPQWAEISQNSYEEDKNVYVKDTYFAPRGLGYDHNMLTQNALLLENEYDANRFVQNLVRLCYAPRLPNPFIVPEGATVDLKNKRWRRQGDLGNLIQQAETVKTIYMLAGIALCRGEQHVVSPKIAAGHSVEYNGVALPGLFDAHGNPTVLRGKYSVTDDAYILDYKLENAPTDKQVFFRFPADAACADNDAGAAFASDIIGTKRMQAQLSENNGFRQIRVVRSQPRK